MERNIYTYIYIYIYIYIIYVFILGSLYYDADSDTNSDASSTLPCPLSFFDGENASRRDRLQSDIANHVLDDSSICSAILRHYDQLDTSALSGIGKGTSPKPRPCSDNASSYDSAMSHGESPQLSPRHSSLTNLCVSPV